MDLALPGATSLTAEPYSFLALELPSELLPNGEELAYDFPADANAPPGP
jgi:hypothetical protein